jgi:hypothetical protein
MSSNCDSHCRNLLKLPGVSVEKPDYKFQEITRRSNSYLLQAVRYIHRNPLSAGLVNRLGAYKMNKEISSSRELLPDIKRILDEVCRSYGVEDTENFKMQRGKTASETGE